MKDAEKRRLEKLEELYAAREQGDECDHTSYLDIFAVFDEISALKVDPTDPHNPALGHFGRPYTQREAKELAVARGLEKRGYTAAEIAERLEGYVEYLSKGEDGGYVQHIGTAD